MKEQLSYVDIRERGVYIHSKEPIYYFTLDDTPCSFSVMAHKAKMDEAAFTKMMRRFGTKKYGYWSVFKSEECIEDAICWLKMIIP